MAADRVTSIRPNPSSEAGWRRIRHLLRWSNSRGTRRLVVLLWSAFIVLDVVIAYLIAYRDPATVGVLAFVFGWLPMMVFRRLERNLAQPTLEDRAVLEYGSDFDKLKEHERSKLFDQQIRENLIGQAAADERNRQLRLRSEALSYRLLSIALPAALCILFGVCLFRHLGKARTTLSFVALILAALVVTVLPSMIRLWSEPNALGEPQVLNSEQDTQTS